MKTPARAKSVHHKLPAPAESKPGGKKARDRVTARVTESDFPIVFGMWMQKISSEKEARERFDRRVMHAKRERTEVSFAFSNASERESKFAASLTSVVVACRPLRRLVKSEYTYTSSPVCVCTWKSRNIIIRRLVLFRASGKNDNTSLRLFSPGRNYVSGGYRTLRNGNARAAIAHVEAWDMYMYCSVMRNGVVKAVVNIFGTLLAECI